MSDRLLKVVIVVVTLVWAANFAAPLWNEDYKPMLELNVAFMTIVGGLIFAGRGQATGGTEEQPPSPPPPPLPPAPTPHRAEGEPSGADPR